MNFQYIVTIETFSFSWDDFCLQITKILCESNLYLFVWILASTPIMEQSPKNVTILDGKDATILCRAVGAPQPNVTWTYNGECFASNTLGIYFFNFFQFAYTI